MLHHLSFIVVIVCMLSTGCTDALKDTQFKITTKRADDRIGVEVEKARMVFSVHSPFGISQAVIESTSGNWPEVVMLRLHLKGLENLKISNGKVTLEAAVSSQDGTVRHWKDGKEDSPLDSTSQNWMEIRLIGNDGKPTKTIPLDDGYFEMQLPNALFEGNPKSITLNWIDFYR